MSQIDKVKDKLGIDHDVLEIEVEVGSDGTVKLIKIRDELDNSGTAEAEVAEDQFSELVRLSREWTATCLGFFEATPQMSFAAQVLQNDTVDRSAHAYIKEKSIETREESETVKVYSMREADRMIVVQKLAEANRVRNVTHIYRDSLLLAVIAEYENLIRKLTLRLYKSDPQRFVGNDATLSARDIFEIDSLELLQEKMIHDKLDGIMRDSHVAQLEKLGKSIGKSFVSDTRLVSEFQEICERRNLITHNGGIVNSRYLRNCRELFKDDHEVPVLGQRLRVGDHYLKRAIARIFVTGFFPLHIIAQTMYPERADELVMECNSMAHDFLAAGLTKMARRICVFSLSSIDKSKKRNVPEMTKVYLTINLALSYFLEDELDDMTRQKKVKEVLGARDWSVRDGTIALALACLREEYEDIDQLLHGAIVEGVGYWEFTTWAVFTKAREIEVFQNSLSERLGMNFN